MSDTNDIARGVRNGVLQAVALTFAGVAVLTLLVIGWCVIRPPWPETLGIGAAVAVVGVVVLMVRSAAE